MANNTLEQWLSPIPWRIKVTGRHQESRGSARPYTLILWSAKDEEQIELLQLNQGEIRVAECLTALPAKNILAAELHDAVIRVREQLPGRERKPDEE